MHLPHTHILDLQLGTGLHFLYVGLFGETLVIRKEEGPIIDPQTIISVVKYSMYVGGSFWTSFSA